MASSLINAPRGGETGGTINRILSTSRYLNTGGRQSFLGTSTATSFSLGKLEHAKLLQSAQYKLAWMLPDGVTERFDDTQQRGWQPVWHAVHKRRFLTPAFNMSNGRLPSSIRAILKSKFPNANL